MDKAKSLNKTKLTQLLILLSLCSLFFSPSYLLAFLHYFNLYFSYFPSQIFSHTIDKNCMFLLCNGLLVFVGITRSFSRSNPDLDGHDHDDDDEPLARNIEVEKVTIEMEELEVGNGEIAEEVEEEHHEMAKVEDEEDDDDDEGKESGVLGLDLKEEKWSENDEILIEENVEERLSTEQMNKKFDDFIRRMKEDLRIEAQRQVVMVYN